MAKILMVSSEAAPFAKTGGLADVTGALPAALAALGEEVAVLLPRYRSVPIDRARRVVDSLPVWLGGSRFDTTVYRIDREVPFLFLDCPPLYDRPGGLYGDASGDYPDNHLRFALLSRGALEIARRLFRPDIFHCHDWQGGLVPAYLRGPLSTDPTFFGRKTVFTIHNLGYTGRFLPAVLPQIGIDPDQFHPNGVEFFGDVSYMKAGLYYSDWLTTVSPKYAQEIQSWEQSWGFEGLLRSRSSQLTGILNGVDYAEWSPEADPFLPATYSAADLRGKAVCKRELLKEMGLPAEAMEKPLAGIVSRFAAQKGLDLLAAAGDALVEAGLAIVALGSGDPVYQDYFRSLAQRHPESVAVRIGFDNGLAHRIEAGADLFLMPSRYEPCGLNQMYSLRYGTVPIVRAVGGLDDTIEIGTGFKFREYTAAALLGAVQEALAAWADRDAWKAMIQRGMAKDFSWRASAGKYRELYAKLLGR
jgi:starch synthase